MAVSAAAAGWAAGRHHDHDYDYDYSEDVRISKKQ